ncbi:SpoIIAA family protein [Methanoculleus taiwanensis]|nr:STAS/SEC14 domain-containing protein [Methanoculleus taiwanensis]
MIELLHASVGNIIGFRIGGTLTGHDLTGILITDLERVFIEYGVIRLLLEIRDFEGEDPEIALQKAIPDELPGSIERLAVVVPEEEHGTWTETALQSALASAGATVRFFPPGRREEAWDWVAAGGKHTAKVPSISGP